MQTLKPLEPMKSMTPQQPWWPVNLGEPSSSGSQNDIRYAFFSGERRLFIEKHGIIKAFDSRDHEISGVSQSHSASLGLTFTTESGRIDLSQLKEVA
jgi:hypothetical protein